MDVFIEKIVSRKKNMKDRGIVFLIGFIAFILVLVVFTFIPALGLMLTAALLYGAYLLMSSLNVEFEYAVTNGDIDIDKIIAQRKRKRVFSGSAKDFEIVAKVNSEHYSNEIKNIKNIIMCAASMNEEDLYFLVGQYGGKKVAVFFQPDERMLNSFKIFIPRKVFQ